MSGGRWGGVGLVLVLGTEGMDGRVTCIITFRLDGCDLLPTVYSNAKGSAQKQTTRWGYLLLSKTWSLDGLLGGRVYSAQSRHDGACK